MTSNLKLSLHKCMADTRNSARNVLNDIADGFFQISHNSFAMLGLALVFVMITLTARPDLREAGETRLMALLLARQEANIGFTEPGAVDRATAANPKDLPSKQAAVAYWLSKKYGVAPEPLSVLVARAFEIGEKSKLDPTLILAIMAIESGFNPFAQSPVGAQGLMQVMTGVHHDKYAHFGGKFAAFDPVTNLRVGVKVLQECITRAGSVEGGLKFYVGAANLDDDGGYTGKVMAEHGRLQAVIAGKQQSFESLAAPAPIPVSFPALPRADSTRPARIDQGLALLGS
jgi:hypothetical protein